MNIHVCSASVYEFNSWTFEYHSYMGPWPIRKDGEPFKRAGKAFYSVVSEWDKLSDEEKKKTKVGGGCQHF